MRRSILCCLGALVACTPPSWAPPAPSVPCLEYDHQGFRPRAPRSSLAAVRWLVRGGIPLPRGERREARGVGQGSVRAGHADRRPQVQHPPRATGHAARPERRRRRPAVERAEGPRLPKRLVLSRSCSRAAAATGRLRPRPRTAASASTSARRGPRQAADPGARRQPPRRARALRHHGRQPDRRALRPQGLRGLRVGNARKSSRTARSRSSSTRPTASARAACRSSRTTPAGPSPRSSSEPVRAQAPMLVSATVTALQHDQIRDKKESVDVEVGRPRSRCSSAT